MQSITLLRLKVEPRHAAELAEIGELCRRGRNAAVTDWLLRQHGLPESDRQRKRLRAMSANERDKLLARGLDPDVQQKSENAKLYAAVTEKIPELSGAVASVIANSVASSLSKRIDWRRGFDQEGKRRRMRDAILAGDDRPPFTTKREIPVVGKKASVAFDDTLSVSIQRPTQAIECLTLGLSLRRLPAPHKKLLRALASGARKLTDSKLVMKDQEWFWHVTFFDERERLSDARAELYPVLAGERTKSFDPFLRMEFPEDRCWYVGDGAYLRAQTRRYIGLRKQIGWRYRFGHGRGHGREKVDAAISRRYEQERNMRSEVLWRSINDALRVCERRNFGVLVYHEPSLPLREKCWFARNDQGLSIDWNWTSFRQRLINAAARRRVEVIVEPWKLKEAMADAKKRSDSQDDAV